MFFFFWLCNSVSSLPSDLLSLFIYINAFTLPQIFYLKWNKPALQLPFCFSRWFFLFFLLLLVCLNSMSVVVLCVLLPALAAPAFPEHWHAHYWAYLKFSFKNSHSHFPGFLSSVLLHIQKSKNLFILLCNKLHRFFLFLKRSECFSHLPCCFLSPYLIISQDWRL